MDEPPALAAVIRRRNPQLASSAHYSGQTLRRAGGEEMCITKPVLVRRLRYPSPPDPLSPKRGEGEKD